VLKDCGWCGEDFETSKNSKRYCCDSCREQGASALLKAYEKRKWEELKGRKPCRWCGRVYVSDAKHKAYCCDRCRTLARKTRHRKGEKAKGHTVLPNKEYAYLLLIGTMVKRCLGPEHEDCWTCTVYEVCPRAKTKPIAMLVPAVSGHPR